MVGTCKTIYQIRYLLRYDEPDQWYEESTITDRSLVVPNTYSVVNGLVKFKKLRSPKALSIIMHTEIISSKIPDTVQRLSMYQGMANVLPSQLTHLYIEEPFIINVILPPNLVYLGFVYSHQNSEMLRNLPHTLRYLMIGRLGISHQYDTITQFEDQNNLVRYELSNPKFDFPDSIETLVLPGNYFMLPLKLPQNLKKLVIPYLCDGNRVRDLILDEICVMNVDDTWGLKTALNESRTINKITTLRDTDYSCQNRDEEVYWA